MYDTNHQSLESDSWLVTVLFVGYSVQQHSERALQLPCDVSGPTSVRSTSLRRNGNMPSADHQVPVLTNLHTAIDHARQAVMLK